MMLQVKFHHRILESNHNPQISETNNKRDIEGQIDNQSWVIYHRYLPKFNYVDTFPHIHWFQGWKNR